MANVQRRNFPGATVAQLRTWLAWCNEEIATGKVNDSWNSGDAGGHKFIDVNLPAERRRDLILNDLSILLPDEFPRADHVRITRTIPKYVCALIGIGLCLRVMVYALETMSFP